MKRFLQPLYQDPLLPGTVFQNEGIGWKTRWIVMAANTEIFIARPL